MFITHLFIPSTSLGPWEVIVDPGEGNPLRVKYFRPYNVGPSSYKLVYKPINYSYKYHKP